MKISYIIPPFEDATYLVRCINSMRRQIEADYEIILSETNFTEQEQNIAGYLKKHPEIIHFDNDELSDGDKLRQAMAAVTGDYVMFIEVMTVVAPCAARAIAEEAEGDIVMAGVLTKDGDNYRVIRDEADGFRYAERGWFCFSKEYVRTHQELFIRNWGREITAAVNIHLIKNGMIKRINESCIYCDESDDLVDNRMSAEIYQELADLISMNPISQLTLQLFHQYVRQSISNLFTQMSGEEEYEYGMLQYFGKTCMDYSLLNRLYTILAGCTPDEILQMDCGSYICYQSYISDALQTKKGSENDLTIPVARKIADQETKLDNLDAKMALMENNVEAMAVNQRLEMQKIESMSQGMPSLQRIQYVDPVREIPEMFSKGRLGLKVILKSCLEWLKYKLHIRREQEITN